jgi:3-phenylpropionate/trans-cinnamate dioxygenase ferredoxin component
MPDPLRLCRLVELAVDEIHEFDLGDRKVCLHLGSDRSLVAFEADCTHRHCPLVDGAVEDGVIMCPCHGAEFDAVTGAVMMGPAIEPIRVYPVWHRDDFVWIQP